MVSRNRSFMDNGPRSISWSTGAAAGDISGGRTEVGSGVGIEAEEEEEEAGISGLCCGRRYNAGDVSEVELGEVEEEEMGEGEGVNERGRDS
jgi:hypothetical protein